MHGGYCIFALNHWIVLFDPFPPGQNDRHFADDIFKCIFIIEKFHILIWILLKFVHKDPINNNSSLVQVMAWCQTSDKPLL